MQISGLNSLTNKNVMTLTLDNIAQLYTDNRVYTGPSPCSSIEIHRNEENLGTKV